MRGVNQAITFVTGHADPDFDWSALARTGQPIVIYMAMRNIEHIITEAASAAALAPMAPAAVIVAATLPEQRHGHSQRWIGSPPRSASSAIACRG